MSHFLRAFLSHDDTSFLAALSPALAPFLHSVRDDAANGLIKDLLEPLRMMLL